MNTAFLLMAQYGRAVVPAAAVARDYFDLTLDNFMRQVVAGSIRLPVVRMSDSQKAARGVHLADLAAYIDRARGDAAKADGA